MPVKQSDIQGYFSLRFPDLDKWTDIKAKAVKHKISLTDLIWTLLVAWLEDRIEIKEG